MANKKGKSQVLVTLALLVLGFTLFEVFNLYGVLLAIIVATVMMIAKKGLLAASIFLVALSILVSMFSTLLQQLVSSTHVINLASLEAQFSMRLVESLAIGLVVLFLLYMAFGEVTVAQVRAKVRAI